MTPQRSDITQFVEGQNNKGFDISEATINGRQIKVELGLIDTPNLCDNEQKNTSTSSNQTSWVILNTDTSASKMTVQARQFTATTTGSQYLPNTSRNSRNISGTTALMNSKKERLYHTRI